MAGSRFSLIYQDENTMAETVAEPAKTVSKAPRSASSKSLTANVEKGTRKAASIDSGAVKTLDTANAGGSLSALSLYLKKKEEDKKAAAAAAAAAASATRAATLPVAEALLSSKPSSQPRPYVHSKKGSSGSASYDRHSRSGPSSGRRHKGDDNLVQLLSTAIDLDASASSAAAAAATAVELAEASLATPNEPVDMALAAELPAVAKPAAPLITLGQYLAERAKNAIALQPTIRVPETSTNMSGWIPLRPLETEDEAYYTSIRRPNAAVSMGRSKSRPSNSVASVPKLTVDPRLSVDYSTGTRSRPAKALPPKAGSRNPLVSCPPRSASHLTGAAATRKTAQATVA